MSSNLTKLFSIISYTKIKQDFSLTFTYSFSRENVFKRWFLLRYIEYRIIHKDYVLFLDSFVSGQLNSRLEWSKNFHNTQGLRQDIFRGLEYFTYFYATFQDFNSITKWKFPSLESVWKIEENPLYPIKDISKVHFVIVFLNHYRLQICLSFVRTYV